MPLVYGAQSGVAGDVVPLMTPTGSVASRVLEVAALGPTGPTGPAGPTGPTGPAGTSIADGTYDGQPVKWDGAAYVPLALGDPLVLATVNGSTDLSLGAPAGTVTLSSLVDILVFATEGINLSATLGLIASAGTQLSLGGNSVDITSATSMQLQAATLGFFGVAPVVQQSITGVLPQDQIDSIVAAGVALGLWTDDR